MVKKDTSCRRARKSASAVELFEVRILCARERFALQLVGLSLSHLCKITNSQAQTRSGEK